MGRCRLRPFMTRSGDGYLRIGWPEWRGDFFGLFFWGGRSSSPATSKPDIYQTAYLISPRPKRKQPFHAQKKRKVKKTPPPKKNGFGVNPADRLHLLPPTSH